jgi:cobyrinic acid a,c-diamide synthase
MPVYAECGGLMYLGRGIRNLQGNEYPMVGAISCSSQIDSPRLSLGYRTVQALGDGPFLRQGEIVRGHEFHWSVLESNAKTDNAYRILEQDGHQEGFQKKNLLASYIHLHLGSSSSMALRLVETCRQFRDGGNRRGTS